VLKPLAIATLVVLLAGCGNDKAESLPAGCSQGPQAIERALAKAPSRVTVDGTPISRCFNRGASGTDTQVVGTNLVAAAQKLADDVAATKPGAAVQLGYLVGAARRGATRSGLGAELVRRIEAEATRLGSQRAAYERGLRAGLAQG
jgi:hypothetical protein